MKPMGRPSNIEYAEVGTRFFGFKRAVAALTLSLYFSDF